MSGGPAPTLPRRSAGRAAPPEAPQRLVGAYSRALVAEAARNPEIVVLDGDLALDCGLIPFSKRFPERFFECGIAEQDMVSQAGGFALRGLLPIVHSFACFPHDPEWVLTETEYGATFPSMIGRGNIMSTQFHPERSGAYGLRLLRNFIRIVQAGGVEALVAERSGAQ